MQDTKQVAPVDVGLPGDARDERGHALDRPVHQPYPLLGRETPESLRQLGRRDRPLTSKNEASVLRDCDRLKVSGKVFHRDMYPRAPLVEIVLLDYQRMPRDQRREEFPQQKVVGELRLRQVDKENLNVAMPPRFLTDISFMNSDPMSHRADK